ncbi:MAG TPA: hypothetical protein VM686_42215 [Polyangiaceae bacterium]|nr:hypothetical protein [Polyangiaceae bacterium]
MRALAVSTLLLLATIEACGGKSRGDEAAPSATGGQPASSSGSSGSAGDESPAAGGTIVAAGSGGADGGGAGSANVEAGSAGAGGAPAEPVQSSWCDLQPPHLFCSDFDGEPYDAAWSGAELQNDGTVQSSVARFVSAPRALLSTIPRRISQTKAEARLIANFPAGAKGATLSFDMFVDPAQPDDPPDPYEVPPARAEIFRLSNGAGLMSLFLDPAELEDGLCFQDQYGCKHSWGSGAIPRETWVHVDFGVVFGGYWQEGGATGSMTLEFDGETAVHWDYEETAAQEMGPIVLSLGLSGPGIGPALAVTYDNVTFDLEP